MNIKPAISPSRFKEILTILVKYGFEDLLGYLNLPGRQTVRRLTRVPEELTIHERIRKAFEALGPTFVKFGQVLSTRADLLPRPLIVELEKLQDHAPPVAWDEMRTIIDNYLPQPVEALFDQVEEKPIAAASLSQVHLAVLREGRQKVALKIQRPSIRTDIERDLDIFAFIARRLHQNMERVQVYDLPGLVNLLRRTLNRELDFQREARNMQIAQKQMTPLDSLRIPSLYHHLCSSHVLVMEHIEGTRPGAVPHQNNAHRLARIGLAAAVQQILGNGFFHADPHPGNILIVEDKALCLLDWGMVGRLTPEDRHRMIDLINGVVNGDTDAVVAALLAISGNPTHIDRRALQIDVMDLLDMHLVAAVEEIRLGMLLLDISDLIHDHRLKIPLDLFLMIKALVVMEATARLIYPRLNIVAELKPHLQRLAMERFNPTRLLRNFRSALFKALSSPARFPKRLAHIVEKIERGEMRLHFEHHNLGPMRQTLDNIFSRLTLGIIAGAMIIGSSLILVTGLPPKLGDYSILGLIGYLLSGLLGIWVVYDILRKL